MTNFLTVSSHWKNDYLYNQFEESGNEEGQSCEETTPAQLLQGRPDDPQLLEERVDPFVEDGDEDEDEDGVEGLDLVGVHVEAPHVAVHVTCLERPSRALEISTLRKNIEQTEGGGL